MATVESITKNRQPVETLQAMVERAYGVREVPDGQGWALEFGNGWFNVAYRICLRSGSEVVVKIAPAPSVELMTYERAAMPTELAALRLIREHTSVPVPAVHFADHSHEICGSDYFFMSYIDAYNLDAVAKELPPGERNAYGEIVGTMNREMNSIAGPGFGPLLGPLAPSWRSVFTGMIENLLEDGENRRVDLGWDYGDVREVVAERADCLDGVESACFVEWDLWEGNVMVRDGAVVGIIDHERAFYGDPLAEFGFFGTQMRAFGDPAPFLRGYGRGPLNETEQWRRRLYCLHYVLCMVVETEYRQYQDPNVYEWARQRLDEAMALFRP